MTVWKHWALASIAIAALACGSDGNGTSTSPATGDRDEENGGKGGKDGGARDAKAPGSGGGGGKNDGGGGTKSPVDIIDDGSPFEQDDTAESGLSGGNIDKLKAGGSDCEEGSVLYPYDGTVFPVGLVPPAIMFREPNDGAYLKLSYKSVDNIKYEVAAASTSPGELTIPAEPWSQVLRRTQGQPLEAEISMMNGGKASTCRFTWRVAQGAMTGSVFYYNNYNHPDLQGQGAVMRLALGDPESELYLRYEGRSQEGVGPCVSCHSVSFNGEMMAASTHNYSPLTQTFETSSYAVSQTEPARRVGPLPESTFAGFTPNGKKMLAMGNPDCTAGASGFPRSPNNFPLLVGPTVAGLHDTTTGEKLEAKGLDPAHYMWMPQFSPAGDMVVFNHAKPGPNGTDRRELAIMDYDDASNTFSNLRVIVSNQGPEPSIDYAPMPTLGGPIPGNCVPNGNPDVGRIPGGACDGPCFPGWPFFTPDGQGVIYALTSEPDFAVAFPGRDTPAKSELWYIDLESKASVRLDNANQGHKPEDALANYYPTMLPVTVGGYYWMFWTSTRDWGHRDTNGDVGGGGGGFPGIPGIPGIPGLPGGDSAAAIAAPRKRIWLSAIRPRARLEGGAGELLDPSSAPFYLDGQSDSGNIRAFAALNPCKQEGSDCVSGIDCCTGFCDIEKDAVKGSCVPPKTCADLQERCTTDENCCPVEKGQPRLCISGFCDIQVL
jgi:hypothetical protein